jgi:hypothetical protein
MDDIAGPLTLPVIMQYVHVREQVETIELDPYATTQWSGGGAPLILTQLARPMQRCFLGR